jgi:hypothetical protein
MYGRPGKVVEKRKIAAKVEKLKIFLKSAKYFLKKQIFLENLHQFRAKSVDFALLLAQNL